jgi:hypothetical protein
MYGKRELKLVDTPALKHGSPPAASTTSTGVKNNNYLHSRTTVISDGDQDVDRVVGWDEKRNAM